jgi:hypothetical protein
VGGTFHPTEAAMAEGLPKDVMANFWLVVLHSWKFKILWVGGHSKGITEAYDAAVTDRPQGCSIGLKCSVLVKSCYA